VQRGKDCGWKGDHRQGARQRQKFFDKSPLVGVVGLERVVGGMGEGVCGNGVKPEQSSTTWSTLDDSGARVGGAFPDASLEREG